MPRVPTYEAGAVQQQGTTGARVATVDNGPGVGAGVAAFGQSLGKLAEVNAGIQDLHDQTNARAKALEHLKFLGATDQQVVSAKNADAPGAVSAATKSLEQYNNSLLASAANPNERRYLQETIAPRSVAATNTWDTHAHSEFVQYRNATDTASVASVTQVAKLAHPELGDAMMGFEGPTLQQVTGTAQATAAPAPAAPGAPPASGAPPADAPPAEKAPVTAKEIILANLRFNGVTDPEMQRQALLKHSTSYYLERARQVLDQSGDAIKATAFIREKMAAGLIDADQGDALITSYRPEAKQQLVRQLVAGHPFPSSPDVEAQPPAEGEPAHKLDPRAFYRSFVKPWEGGVVRDVNGSTSNLGFNQAANPDVNVKELTPAQATERFVSNYWHKSGADKLSSPALAAEHADTFFIGEAGATRILRESGGDPTRYMELRRQWMADMVAKNPAKFGPVAKGWENRNKALEQYASTLGGDGRAVPPVTIDTTSSQIRPYWEGRTDLPVDVRLAAADEAIRQRNELKSDRDSTEAEAGRQAQTIINGLDAKGKGITSLGQLPPALVARLSPSTISSIQSQIATNNKPEPIKVSDATEFELELTRQTDKAKFTSPEFYQRMAAKLPADRRTAFVRQIADVTAEMMSQKPKPVSDEVLLSHARPAFAASGISLDFKPTDSQSTKQANFATRTQALKTLREQQEYWVANNPGKAPDDNTINKWIGNALTGVGHTPHRVFNATDDEVAATIPPGLRPAISTYLQQAHLPPTNANKADAYRRILGRVKLMP